MKKVQIGKRYRTIAEVHASHGVKIGFEFQCDHVFEADGFPGSADLPWDPDSKGDKPEYIWLCVPEESESNNVWEFIEEVPEK